MARCAKSLGKKACLIRRSLTSGEGGIRSSVPIGEDNALATEGGAESGAQIIDQPADRPSQSLAAVWASLTPPQREALVSLLRTDDSGNGA
jgi:hypothetical protein